MSLVKHKTLHKVYVEAEQLEPSPVRRPDRGPGQAEVDADDAGAALFLSKPSWRLGGR